MPELPEVVLYLEALERALGGKTLERVRLKSPSLLRTWDPPLSAVQGKRLLGFRRIGKRVVWELEDELFLVFHLMVSGRFHMRKPSRRLPCTAERGGSHVRSREGLFSRTRSSVLPPSTRSSASR